MIEMRILRAFQLRDKNFGKTAPKMTKEAAEKWRASYRRYRHEKHEKKKTEVAEEGLPHVNAASVDPNLKEKKKAFKQIKIIIRGGKGHKKERRKKRDTENMSPPEGDQWGSESSEQSGM